MLGEASGVAAVAVAGFALLVLGFGACAAALITGRTPDSLQAGVGSAAGLRGRTDDPDPAVMQ